METPPHKTQVNMVTAHTHTLCLQDLNKAVRDTHPTLTTYKTCTKHRVTHSTLSAYKTHTKHGRWSDTHPTHSLPTRPAQSTIRDTHSTLCLQDPHEAWSLVRDTHPTHSLPTRPARSMVAGQRHTPHTLSAYKTRIKHGHRHRHTPYTLMVTGQRHTPRTLSAYKTHTKHGHQSETHTLHTLCLQDPH